MPKSPEEMAASMIKNLKEKTGKTMDEWLPIIKKSGLEKNKEIINFLKADYGVTYGFANLLAQTYLKGDAPEPTGDELVESQYSGGKADLKPIYIAIIREVESFGNDVETAPKKAYVSLRRSKQFAIIQPSTKTRIDVGINLKGTEPTDRLESSGSFNAMCSHRVRITEIGEVNDELINWLKMAYKSA